MDETLNHLVEKLLDVRKKIDEEIEAQTEREGVTAELLERVGKLAQRLGIGDQKKE